MHRTILYILSGICAVLPLFPAHSLCQQPPDDFYHMEYTVLPYAGIDLTLPEGMHKTVPFTPLIIDGAPAGSGRFTRNIDVRGRIVFAGNGIVVPNKGYNAYGTYNLQSRIVLIAYNIPQDYQGRFGEKSDLHVRIHEAELRGAAAVLVFGIPGPKGWNAPFVKIPETIPPVSLPTGILSWPNAKALLESGGVFLTESGMRKYSMLPNLEPIEVPVAARLTMKSALQAADTEHFHVKYLPGILSDTKMQRYVADKERALHFIADLFLLGGFDLPVEKTVYFPDYTSLYYFTGNGGPFTGREGDFLLFPTRPELLYKTNFHYFVRELTPRIVESSWGASLPIFELGLAKMAEQYALPGDSGDIDETVATWIGNGTGISFVSSLNTGIDPTSAHTDSLSTLAGSFLKFLWKGYSQARIKRLYAQLPEAENTAKRIALFNEIYLKDLLALQREWTEMIAMKYSVANDRISEYMSRLEESIRDIPDNNNRQSPR